MIRQAAAKDHMRLTSLSFASKRHWNYPEEYYALWKDELTITPAYITDNTVHVFEQDGDIRAYYSLKYLSEPLQFSGAVLEPGLWLDHMFVDPLHMGRGIGRMLFTHCLAKSREKGAAVLWILADPNSSGFYESMGCSHVADFPSSIGGRTTPLLRFSLERNAGNVPPVPDHAAAGSPPGPAIDYRRINLDEAEAIRHLWLQLNELHQSNSVHHKNHFARFTFEERLQQLAAAETATIFVASCGSAAVGYCICSLRGSSGEIDSLFVENSHRGKGIGGQLLNTALQWLKKQRAANISVAVAHGNESALPFYHSFGFRERLIMLTLEEPQ